jgi:chromosome partitioning protein
MAFALLRPDLVLTPLAGSQLEAAQAVKAAEIVRAFGKHGGRSPLHRCLLTRISAALRPRSLAAVLALLRANDIELLPTALLEKEAFRALFSIGGGFASLEASHVSGLSAAKANAADYVEAVLNVVRPPTDLGGAGGDGNA